MQRLNWVLVISILAAACSGSAPSPDPTADTTQPPGSQPTTSTGDTTGTTATPTTASTTSGTTTPAGPFSWVCDLEVCAYIAESVVLEQSEREHSSTSIPGTDIDPPGSSGHCRVVSGQVVLFNPGRVPVQYGDEPLSQLTDADFPTISEMGVEVYEIPQGQALFDVIDELRAQGFLIAPNYIHATAPAWKYGPAADDPEVIPGAVITGSTKTSASRVVRVIDYFDTNAVDGPLGHGQFIRSLIEAYSTGTPPVSEVWMSGQPSEVEAAERIASQTAPEEIVNLSFGTYPCRPGDIPVGMLIALANLMADESVIVTAAAGNDGHRFGQHALFFPAAFGLDDFWFSSLDLAGEESYLDWLVRSVSASETLASAEMLAVNADRIHSVGALYWDGAAWQKSTWSNDAETYSPGEQVAAEVDLGSGSEAWVWSGTSFAAPIFAACLSAGGDSTTCGVP